jgi:23S rRNA pseudouridine1911/1915/1917 synthase
LLIAKNIPAFDYAKEFFKSRNVAKEYLTLVNGKIAERHGLIEKALLLDPARKRVVVSQEGKPAKTEYTIDAYYEDQRFFIEDKSQLSGNSKERGIENPANLENFPTNVHDPLLSRDIEQDLEVTIDLYTLVRVILHTGRTHQIRVHFASIGHPVAGDATYGKGQPVPKGLSRQFLHAARLMFRLPNGTALDLESELPPDLHDTLTNLQRIEIK